MLIERLSFEFENHRIPAVGIIPAEPGGGVLLVHGYGGCKEEVLGLAWRLAEKDLAVCTIDLPGHGENTAPLTESIGQVEAVLKDWQHFGPVVIVGQSLGGRLALSSSAEFVIAISPPLGADVGRSLRFPLKNMRSHRVKGGSFEEFLTIFRSLPPPVLNRGHTLIILGERDFKEVSAGCLRAEEQGIPVRTVDKALHSDVFLHEEAFTIIAEQIRQWFA